MTARNHKLVSVLLSLAIIGLLFGCQRNPQLNSGEGYINVKGGRIWYRVIGKGRETPLLLTHGGPGGTSRSFYHFASLSKDRPVILFDQLGSGRSDHHTDTSLLKVDNFVEQIAALKSHLGLKKFYLHGHSWGTALALAYYSKYPEGVEALIFNSPYFSTSVWKADADTLILTLPDSVQLAIRTGEETNDYASLSYQMANTVFAKHFGVRTARLTSELDTVPAPGSTFIYNYMWGPTEFTATGTLKTYDNLESLRKIKVPTLFITGEFDEARPKTVRYFQTLVPDSKFIVIEGAGHGTMHDNLDQNIGAIRSFLDQVDMQK